MGFFVTDYLPSLVFESSAPGLNFFTFFSAVDFLGAALRAALLTGFPSSAPALTLGTFVVFILAPVVELARSGPALTRLTFCNPS